ncbi:MAG: hypothetical protein WCP86_07220, partial [bacterium]
MKMVKVIGKIMQGLFCEIRCNRMLFCLLPLVVMLAACSPSNMLKKDDNFNIMTVKPSPGKAALVVART